MGRSHAKAWLAKSRANVVAVMDMNKEAAETIAAEHDAAAYSDYNAMLKREKLDIVSVTTWQSVRAEITVAAAAAGVGGVLGEKPMASSVGEADAITPPPVEIDQFDEFLDWMDGKIPTHRNHGHQACITMEIMMAIYESLEAVRKVAPSAQERARRPISRREAAIS